MQIIYLIIIQFILFIYLLNSVLNLKIGVIL